MRHTVIVAPNLKAHSDIVLPTSYNVAGKMRMLVDENHFIEMDLATVAEKNFAPIKFRPITFNKDIHDLKYVYETRDDDGGKMVPKTEMDAAIQKVVEVFWKNHPLCLVNGKPHGVTNLNPNGNTRSPIFDVVDEVIKDAENLNTFDNKFAVAQHIKEMDYDQKCEVAYFMGISPVGISDPQLLLKLADFSRGLCMSDAGAKKFMDAFGKERLDENVQYYVAARMALEQGLILNQPKDGRDNYYHGSAMVGTSIDDIVLHFKRDPRLFNEHILRQLKKDRTQELEAGKHIEATARGENSSDNVADIEEMRTKIKALKKEKIDGKPLVDVLFNQNTAMPEKLREVIADAEKKRAESTVSA